MTINESFTYELIEILHDNKPINIILAQDLVDSTLERIGVDKFTSLGTCKGTDLLRVLMLNIPILIEIL